MFYQIIDSQADQEDAAGQLDPPFYPVSGLPAQIYVLKRESKGGRSNKQDRRYKLQNDEGEEETSLPGC